MATITCGTAATSTLTGIIWTPGMSVSDLATIRTSLKHDKNPSAPIEPGIFANNGILVLPARFGSHIKLQPGDLIAFDPATGWPIVLSAKAAAGASWVHS